MSAAGFLVYLIAPTIKLPANGPTPPANLQTTPHWAVLRIGDCDCLAAFTTHELATEFINGFCLHGFVVSGFDRGDLVCNLGDVRKRVEHVVLDPSVSGPNTNRIPLDEFLHSTVASKHE